MKALALEIGTNHLRLTERPEPKIALPTEVRLRVLRVGICGTDREEAAGGRALAPTGNQDLVLGHEMLGQVLEVGANVTRVRVGDLAVATVRRGCQECLPCKMGRPDMCQTGKYLERGIWGLDGFQAEQVVDDESYLVQVPGALAAIGVLVEPLSVVEKAIDEALRTQQSRLPDAATVPDWLNGRKCLVAGLGPIGLLACLALRLRGADVFGLDLVDDESVRPQWLEGIGGRYVDGRRITVDQVDDRIGAMSLIFEATGIGSLAFDLMQALAPNGVYVLTGIPGGSRPTPISADALIRDLVLRNLLMVGSVNAALGHYRMAVNDLEMGRALWGDHIEKLITHHFAYADFDHAFHFHDPNEIKAVLEWTSA
jgi:glucose 1-dehydrogenase